MKEKKNNKRINKFNFDNLNRNTIIMTNSDNDSDNSDINYRKSRRRKSSRKEEKKETKQESPPNSPPKPAPEPVEEIVEKSEPILVSELVKEEESVLGDINPLMVGGTLLLAVGAAVCGGFLAMRNAAN